MKTGFIYCDSIASACVGLMILSTSLPLIKNSGVILLETAPEGLDIGLVIKDIKEAHNVDEVTGIHVWKLSRFRVFRNITLALKD